MNKFVIAIAGLLILTLAYLYYLYAAVQPKAHSFWQVSDENSTAVVPHSTWQNILSKYVKTPDETTRFFDYASVTPSDKKALALYLVQLQHVEPRKLNKTEQLAFWVNLYNALTVKLVLDNYPIDSIKEIGNGITGPWNMTLATISTKKITLNTIEHGILRPIWQDNRIHYVINCASKGCPDISNQALLPHRLNQQLAQAATRFINQTKAVNFSQGKLVLSSIYNWFSADFGETNEELIKHLSLYAKPTLKRQLLTYRGEINFHYDWKLNSR